MTQSESSIARSSEFKTVRHAEGHGLLRLAAGLLAAFALIATIAVIIFQYEGDWVSSLKDHRQVSRLLIATIAITLLICLRKFEMLAVQNFELVSIFVWSSMMAGLTSLVIAQFNVTLSGNTAETPHNRYSAAVLIVSIVVYTFSTLSTGKNLLLLAPPTGIVLLYNFEFLDTVEATSFSTYFLVIHLIGITFAKYRLKKDVELFVKTRDLEQALGTIRISEAREKEISAAKTRLIGSVSHDLRQPLNSLALYNNLLKSKFGGEQNAALNSIAERVQECVSAMEGNLTRLQDIAQLQARTI